LSDIAFDDVSILTDQDCTDGTDSNEDDERKEPEDADGIYDVESCVNRCFENATVQLYVNKTLTCSCSADCYLRESCCPDFIGKIWNLKLKYRFLVYETRSQSLSFVIIIFSCLHEG
jgi:hypothetical protein